jgi:hypothetical protein
MNQGLDKRPLVEEEAPSSQAQHHIVNSNKQTNKHLATAAQSFELHLRHAVGSQKHSKQETRENQEPEGGRGRGDSTRSTNLQPVANRFVAPQRVSNDKKKIKGTYVTTTAQDLQNHYTAKNNMQIHTGPQQQQQ